MMQLSETNESHGKFLARSLLTTEFELIDPEALFYVFTAGAAEKNIEAALLTRCAFCKNEVYVRTGHGLYVLVRFKHLKHVQAVLSDVFFSANRGVLVNWRRIHRPAGSRSVEFRLRDSKGQPVIELVSLSKDGRRKVMGRILAPGATP